MFIIMLYYFPFVNATVGILLYLQLILLPLLNRTFNVIYQTGFFYCFFVFHIYCNFGEVSVSRITFHILYQSWKNNFYCVKTYTKMSSINLKGASCIRTGSSASPELDGSRCHFTGSQLPRRISFCYCQISLLCNYCGITPCRTAWNQTHTHTHTHMQTKDSSHAGFNLIFY